MPTIPAVPTLDPVAKPYISPAEAGRPGEAIARMGETGEDIALEGLQLEAHIRKAQEHVDTLASGNDLDAAYAEMQTELSKTTNSRDVPDILAHAHDTLNAVAKKWHDSPAAVMIQMNADSLRPGMEHLAQVRQIDLMGKEWDAQSTLQVKKLLPLLVAARRSGDKEQEQQVLGYLNGMYDQAISAGLKTDADKQLGMSALGIAAQKEQNEAVILSPDAGERKRAIAQLSKGGKGPLDVTDMGPGDVNAMLEHAQEADKRLTELSEAQSLNGALNIVANVFSSPEYKDNFEAQQKALDDGEWLKQHGIVDANGQPDRVMAEKLSAEVERARTFRKQEQADQDDKIVEKYSPLIDENKLTRGQIDQIPGLSNRARASLQRQWTENWRINRSMAIAERSEARQEREDKSTELTGNIIMEIASGKLYEPMDIRTMPGLSPKDKVQLLGAIQESRKDPSYQAAVNYLSQTFPLPVLAKGAGPADVQQRADQSARQSKRLAMTYEAWQKRVNENPKEDKVQAMHDVMQPAIQEDISNRINQMLGSPPESLTQRRTDWVKQNFHRLLGVSPSSASPLTPPVGTVREYKGDNYKFKGGDQYDQKNWEKQ